VTGCEGKRPGCKELVYAKQSNGEEGGTGRKDLTFRKRGPHHCHRGAVISVDPECAEEFSWEKRRKAHKNAHSSKSYGANHLIIPQKGKRKVSNGKNLGRAKAIKMTRHAQGAWGKRRERENLNFKLAPHENRPSLFPKVSPRDDARGESQQGSAYKVAGIP